MSSFLEHHNIDSVIKKNNSLISKKAALKELLSHDDIKGLLKKSIDDNKNQAHKELITILLDNNWNLDQSIEVMVETIYSNQ